MAVPSGTGECGQGGAAGYVGGMGGVAEEARSIKAAGIARGRVLPRVVSVPDIDA